MSVTFTASTIPEDYEAPATCVNISNQNAEDLLAWIGIPYTPRDPYGEMPVAEFKAKCMRRLWDTRNAADPHRPPTHTKRPGKCTCIDLGRRENYLHERTNALLALAEAAGPGATIHWS